ncbi:MAG: hypothetical protein DI539_02165 [Flavobacterium psychrophilum]|nr:MAG: hypothetical protein DI539_02165 [Flavobacterium psychrophilum]
MLFVLCISLQLSGQEKMSVEMDEFKTEIQPYFDKIKEKDMASLVPFYKDGLWGYLDGKTLKVVVPPFANLLNFYGEVPEFMGNSFLNGSKKGFLLNIENGKIQMNYTDLEKTIPPPMMSFSRDEPPRTMRRSFFGATIKPHTEGYRGFEYKISDGSYILTAYSDLYNPDKETSPDITDLVMDKQLHLIVKRDFLYGIIDSSGVALKGFDFKFKKILPVQLPGDHDVQWFLVAEVINDEEVYSFINQKGEYRLKHQLNPQFYSLWNTGAEDYPYYKIKYNQLGYVVSNGVLYDLVTLKKPMKPEPNLYISYLKVILTDTENNDVTLEKAREKAKVFVLIEEGENKFYMDLSGKKYQPK